MPKSENFSHQYDAHGLVGIWSNIELGQFPRSYRKDVRNPDIVVSLRDTPPLPKPESFRYAYSSLKNLRTVVTITEEDGRTNLEISDDLRRLTGGLRPALSNLISSAFYVKLLLSGRLLLHGAVLETDGRGVLVAAPSETGKTSTTISLVRNSGYTFLSDDMSIIEGTNCYSFPIDLKIESMESLHGAPIDRGKRFEYSWRKVAKSLPLSPQLFAGYFYITPEELFAKRAADRTKIDTIVFLERGPDKMEEIDGARALDMLVSQHRIGIGSFDPFRNEIFMRYAYSSGSVEVARVADSEIELCRDLVRHAQCYLIRAEGHEFDKGIISVMSHPRSAL